MKNDAVLAQKLPLIVADLQELVLLCPDPIIAVNRAGIIVLFNAAARRLLGYEDFEVIERLAIRRVCPTADHARHVKKQALRESRPADRGLRNAAGLKRGARD